MRTIQGFTLLEILIAMAVFAVMSAMAYSGLRVLLDAYAATSVRSERLGQLQTTLNTLNEDLTQAVLRPIRDQYGATEPAFAGGQSGAWLTLTREVPAWSAQAPGIGLQRIGYVIENGALYRSVWSQLDRSQQTSLRRRKLIDLKRVTIRFYGSEWREYWPPTVQNTNASGVLPNAVETVFEVPGLGEIRRLFFLRE